MNGKCSFETADGEKHDIDGKWDMILAFPPCTYLTITGNRWFDVVKYGYDAQNRWNDRCIAISFFLSIAYADCEKIAIENPVGVMSTFYRKPDQIIQPCQFGHHASKKTCLWLKGLPHLVPTDIVDEGTFITTGKDNKRYTEWLAWCKDENGKTLSWNDQRTAKLRSKTFPGVAKAMAEQWAGDARKD